MTDQERVHALVKEGKINEEEAKLLLEAIDEADAAEAEAEAFASNDAAEPTPSSASSRPDDYEKRVEELYTAPPSEPNRPSSGPPPRPKAPPSEPSPPQGASAPGVERPSGLRWLTIKMMAKNLEIRVDESLSEPDVRGAQLERDGAGWRIEAQKLESLLSGNVGLDIRLPPEVGVDLSTKAGNVEVKGVPYFRGRIAAGNVELAQVHGIDLELKAGNLDAELLLTEGEHRVQVSMGNADVELLRGSDVRVSGRATMGGLNIAGPTKLGEGKANLDLLVKMGNLDVKVPRE